MKTHRLTLLLLLAGTFAGLAETRTWTDTQGRKLEAAYTGREEGKVLLKDASGRLVAVPLERLSAEDQKWLATAPAPVVSVPVDQTVAAAAVRIDELIDRKLAQKGIPANPPASDETFVRRAYLDIAGRIPNRAEATAFLEDASPQKRSQLIRALLNSDGYTSHLYNYFAAMLRVRDPDNGGLMKADPYVAWIKEQVRNNRPYNEMVAEEPSLSRAVTRSCAYSVG